MTTHIMPRGGRLPPYIGMRVSVSPLGPETSREYSQYGEAGVSFSAPVPGSSSDGAYETHRSRATSDGAFPRRRFRCRDGGRSIKDDRSCCYAHAGRHRPGKGPSTR